jgi:group I intron endonuclease
MLIAFPSFKLLYLMDEVSDPSMSVLAEGLGGPKSYILNKKVNTLAPWGLEGSRINIFSQFAFLHCRWFNTRVRAASRIGPHNQDVVSVIVGSLLGDSIFRLQSINRTFSSSGFTDRADPTIQLKIDQSNSITLNPYWVTGFADGEATFMISILKSKDRALGWRVTPIFAIKLGGNDLELLNRIKSFFGVGKIVIVKSDGSAIFSVKSVKDIFSVIIPHFDKYPLLTKKQADYILFKTIVELIVKKEHLTREGLNKIVELKSVLNKGELPIELAKAYPVIKFIQRPFVLLPENINVHWFVGFVDAEGSFYVNIIKDATKTGYSVQLRFSLTQHIRDAELFNRINKWLGGSHVYERPEESRVDVIISKLSNIVNILIPIFNIYNLQGIKEFNYNDFLTIVKLMENKEHLTLNGIDKIKQIKSGMNSGRYKTITTTNGEVALSSTKVNNSLTSKIQKRTFHASVKAVKRIGPHNQDIFSVITGSLLGNAIITRSVEGTRICYRQSSIHKDYLFWLYNFFYTRGYCTNLEPRMYTRLLKLRGKEVQHFGYEFNTFTFRSFNWLHEMFYHKGKKVLNPKIEEFITPLSLAILISSQPKSSEELKFYTGLHREEDINKLTLMLKNRYGFICYIFKDKNSFYGIGIANESKDSFRALVQPYLHKIENPLHEQVKPCINLSLNANFGLGNKLVKGNRYYSTKSSSLPVASYSNPINLKSIIYKENNKKGGIYRWTNIISGKIYIGSSSNLNKRFSGYFSINYLTKESLKYKSIIYSALLKYGYSNFKLDVLEYSDPKDLLVREQFYLDLYSPEYNILTTAGSNFGFKHSDETLLKFKLRKFSKEHLEFLRKSGSANFTEFNKNKRLKVVIHDFSTDITTSYDSIDQASKAINVDSKAFWTQGKSEQKNNDVIPYQGRFVITLLRDGITKIDHIKRVELARVNIPKGLINWKRAKGNVVVVTNIMTKETVNYDSVSEAARALDVNRFTISRRIKDQKILNGLYKFTYL